MHHLHYWLNDGTPPPGQPRIEFAGDPAEVVRDEHGLATGGVRLPQVDVPVATNSSLPLGDDLFSVLSGSCVPFPPDKTLALYGDKVTYLARYEEAARRAGESGVLRQRDVEALLQNVRDRVFP